MPIRTMIIQTYKAYKDYIKFDTEQVENTERRKISFPNKYVKNVDLYKPVLENIINTHK